MTRIAPLIYARTYQCDFNTGFLVKPDDFFSSDVQWAREKVLSATAEIDLLNGFRWVIAKKENKFIAGIVCFIKDLVKSAQLTDEELKGAQSYFTDDKGRRIYAFIGLSISDNKEPLKTDFSYEYFWNIFKKFVEPVWQAKSIDTIVEQYTEYFSNKIENITKPNILCEEINNVKYYEQNPKTDKLLFDYYLQKAVNMNINFCSNIEDINVLKRQKFSIVTTKQNNIERLREQVIEPPKTKEFPSAEGFMDKPLSSSNDTAKKKRANSTSKCNKFVPILGIIIVVLVLVIILLK